MEKYKMVNITSICDIQIGKTPRRNEKSYWGMGSKWISISDMKSKYINNTKEEITPKGIKESNIKIVPKNTIIMSFKLSIGKVAITQSDMYTNEAIAAFHIKYSKELNFHFLYYTLQTLNLKENTDKAVMGLTLNKKKLQMLKIPLPPLEIQNKIVETLDESQNLIDERKEQIKLLDDLIKSIFYDMFGDPVSNPKGWEIKKLENILSKIGSGSTPRGGNSAYHNEGISLIRSLNIYDNEFKYKSLAFIDENQANKLKNVSIEKNDVLLNITGASVCRCSIVPDNVLPARVNQHVSILRVKPSNLNESYLCNLIISNRFKKFLIKIATSNGATREALTKDQLKKLNIPVPPIELQTQFAKKVEKIEKQKEKMKKSLTEMENNFNSLMQRAFKGELF